MLTIKDLLKDEGIGAYTLYQDGETGDSHLITHLDYIETEEDCRLCLGRLSAQNEQVSQEPTSGGVYLPACTLSAWIEAKSSILPSLKRALYIISPDTNEASKGIIRQAARDASVPAVYYIPCCNNEGALYRQIRTAISNAHLRLEQLVTHDYTELVDLVAQGISFRDIERFANKLLKNPIIILDHSYKVLAFTQREDFFDPIWHNTTSNEVMPADDVEAVDVNNFWSRLQRSPVPLFVDNEALNGLPRRVVALIKIGSSKRGYITMLEKDKRITAIDLIILQMLADVLSVKFSEADSIAIATGQLRDAFCRDLLQGNMKHAVDIRNRARILGLSIGPWAVVLYMQPLCQGDKIAAQLESIKNDIRMSRGSCIYTYDDSRAYLIVSFRDKKRTDKFLRDTLPKIMDNYDFICCTSLPVSNITLLANCLEQAEKVGRLLSSSAVFGAKVYRYSEYAPLCLVAEFSLLENKDRFKSRGYQTLVDIDRKEGTEYIKTLRSFFICNQNVSQTAQMMFLHRNTINYRLGRIRELLDDDFDDCRIRLHLQLSILAEDIANEG